MTVAANNPPAIDIDMLTMALQVGDLKTCWWLDTKNGDVIPSPDSEGDAAEQKMIKQKQRSPDRYIDIEPIAEAVHFELMESYAATLERSEICEALLQALQRKQPAWHFRNALAEYPECEDNWYAFKDGFYALQARQWIRERGLQPVAHAQDADGGVQGKRQPGAAANDTQCCLELAITDDGRQRRYIVWQQGQQISLAVYDSVAGDDEQLLVEIEINEYQLSGISEIVETFKPSIAVPPRNSTADTCLYFSNEYLNGEIHGSYKSDAVFARLASMLDMLLALPAFKA